MLVVRIFRLIFRSRGPRREAADKMEAQLDKAAQDNRAATARNLRAVQGLIDDSLQAVNWRDDDA